MSNISLNYAQIIDPLSFKSINLAKIYIGEYGTLPNPANASTWKQAYFVNSDGTRTAASQPIRTNASGYAVDGSGNIKTIQVDGGYSLLVQDQLSVTKFSQACSAANSGAVLEFDTIAGFTGALDGSVCYFKGRDTVGDGGGGPLRFLAGSTATANGVTVYAVNGGRLVREGWSVFGVNVKWAGAKGDGVTDDTAAIQLAVNSIGTGGGQVNFPKGIYRTGPLTIPGDRFISIVGELSGLRTGASTLVFTHTDGRPCIDLGASRTKAYGLYNLKIEANAQTGHGVQNTSSGEAYCAIENVWVQSAGGDGFHLENVFIFRGRNMVAEACGGHGIYGDNVNDCEFLGVDLTRCGGYSAYIKSGVSNRITGNGDAASLGGFYVEEGQANDLRVYYETPTSTYSMVGVKFGAKTTGNRALLWQSHSCSVVDYGVGNMIDTGRGSFSVNQRRLVTNIGNANFEQGAVGAAVTNWFSGSTPAATFVNDSVGVTGQRSMKIAFPAGTSYANEFTASIASTVVGDKLYIEFWAKSDRELSAGSLQGEYVQMELVGDSTAWPKFYFIFHADTRWRKYQAVLTVTTAGTNVRPRFKAVNIASTVNVNIADLVFTKSLQELGSNLYGSKTFDPVAAADGNGQSTNITVNGAAPGDFVQASFSNDLQGMILTAWVSSANTVTCWFQNESGGSLDLPSGTLRVIVTKAS